MDIQIQKNQGIIAGIKTKLNEQNYETSNANSSIWTQVMKEVAAENKQNKAHGKELIYLGGDSLTGDGHKNFVVKEGVIEFSQNLWNKICSFFKPKSSVDTENTINNTKNIPGTTGTPETSDLDKNSVSNLNEKYPSARESLSNLTLDKKQQKHQEVVENSVKYIEQYFDASGLGNHFKSEEDKKLFLQCLKETVYDKDRTGAGHAEAGIIHIETNNEEVNSLAEMTRLLIHEANHAFIGRKSEQNGTLNFPTKAEEIECETLALTTMSYFVQNVKGMDDYEIYGQNISTFKNKEIVHSNPEFQNWLNGYQQLADNLDGDVTIQHSPYKSDNRTQINIKHGDIITIEGEPQRIIGEDAYLEGINDTAIGQLIMHKSYYNTPENERMPDSFGDLIFEDLLPTSGELQQAFGKDFNISDCNLIPFTVSRKNPETGALEIVYKGNKFMP